MTACECSVNGRNCPNEATVRLAASCTVCERTQPPANMCDRCHGVALAGRFDNACECGADLALTEPIRLGAAR